MEQNKLTSGKIYSIQTEPESSGLIEIEIIILKGLYRFSLLGINQKHSSDIKDRVYSALRAQKILNLKSDNKKITVSLLPTNVEKKSTFYDLGIALSCLSAMGYISINEDMLTIGELSILGNIISTNVILMTIHQAIQNNIRTIVCSPEDIKILDKGHANIVKLLSKHNIRFIVSDNLKEMVERIKNKTYHQLHQENNTSLEGVKIEKPNLPIEFGTAAMKIILALCTNRNVFIENKKNSNIKKFIKNIMYYSKELGAEDILKLSNTLKIGDRTTVEKYSNPQMSIFGSQTSKDEVDFLLKESLFGFNVVEDILQLPEDILHTLKKKAVSSIICFYNPCPCGNNTIFFNEYTHDRCLCLQRHIIKHRQKVSKVENSFFDFYVQDEPLEYTADEYIQINQIIIGFNRQETEIETGKNIQEILNTYPYEKEETGEIISLAKDITRFEHIIQGKKALLTEANINLAVEFLKKDF